MKWNASLRPNALTGCGADATPRRVRTPDELDARLRSLAREFGEEITLDALAGEFRMYQRRRGHRHSVDDLLTAWYAAMQVSAPAAILDLGTGIGSVGLALAWKFPSAKVTAVEVQDGSFRLLQANVWANDVPARIVHGDLRELGADSFDLVTGSPPYFDVKNGMVSADPQRAAARFELHGDVRDYCHAARRSLGANGVFVFCFPSVQKDRALRACADATLAVRSMRDVVPREGLAPLFSLFACARQGHGTTVEAPFVVRDRAGTHTEEMTRVRASFGHGSG